MREAQGGRWKEGGAAAAECKRTQDRWEFGRQMEERRDERRRNTTLSKDQAVSLNKLPLVFGLDLKYLTL